MRHAARLSGSLPTLAAVGIAAALGMTTAPAVAETVPTPRPALQAPPTPVLPNPRMRAVTDGTLDASQRAQVAKISSYLSGLSTLVGKFVQVAPNGTRTTGEFYMQKPGKMRFAYDPPSPVDYLVSDGKSVVVRERKFATQDVYPLSQTPLRYLLSDRIDLLKDTNVVAVSSDDVFTTVTIEEKHAMIGTSRLMLMIGTKDNQLKQWTITDPQGYDITIAVYNLNTQKKPDPDLFRIDFTKFDDGRGG